MDLSDAAVHAAWNARLDLGYERRDGRTVLARREHYGPLRVQRNLYPEGEATCHTIVVHPPGGIAGGDALAINARLGEGSAALLTTPGAGKWYRSAGRGASQSLNFDVGGSAVLEWLPQESIVFDGAVAQLDTRVNLGGDATYMGWEVLCFGRGASGERYTRGSLRMRTELRRDGRRLWLEQGRVDGGDALLESPVGMAGRTVCGTLLAAAPGLDGEAARELLAACREIPAAEDDEGRAIAGITCLPGVLIARWLGDEAEQARAYFTAQWMRLRPALKRSGAQVPRIWST